MIEVEIKLPLGGQEQEISPDQIVEKLVCLGFSAGSRLKETDIYFDNDADRIRSRGEALRVRKVETLQDKEKIPKWEADSTVFITFKGQKLDHVSMTRRELETKVENADICIELFCAMGYFPVEPKVIKQRQNYHKGNMTACIDRVENLGNFLELEIVIPETEDEDAALRRIEELLCELGYGLKDTIQTSYLSLLQGK